MDRRSLMKRAGIAGVLASGIAPAVHAQAAVRWRLASSFPKSLDTIFGSAETFAKTVKELSGGKFEVSTHAAGELMPAFGVVDAIQNGTIEMAQTAPYYFTGKNPIFAFGCAVPFGLTARQMDSWMEHGNGRKLMDAFYAQYNIKSASGLTASYLAVMSRAATFAAASTMALFSGDSASNALVLMKNSSSAPPSHQPG